MATASWIRMFDALAIASGLWDVLHACRGVCSERMCCSNFVHSLKQCSRYGVLVGWLMFRVVQVAAYSDMPPDPVSYDQFLAPVGLWPLVHVRTMIVGR